MLSNPYPNPTNNIVSIDLQLIESSYLTIAIYNNIGQLKFQSTNNLTNGNNKLTFDVQTLSPGIYYLTIQGQKDQISKRFIKK